MGTEPALIFKWEAHRTRNLYVLRTGSKRLFTVLFIFMDTLLRAQLVLSDRYQVRLLGGTYCTMYYIFMHHIRTFKALEVMNIIETYYYRIQLSFQFRHKKLDFLYELLWSLVAKTIPCSYTVHIILVNIPTSQNIVTSQLKSHVKKNEPQYNVRHHILLI